MTKYVLYIKAHNLYLKWFLMRLIINVIQKELFVAVQVCDHVWSIRYAIWNNGTQLTLFMIQVRFLHLRDSRFLQQG